MRKITVLTMITLDGVMQAPGGPEEDTEGGFTYGGWTQPYSDDVSQKLMAKEMERADYLLGRKTFKNWENYWPKHADFWPGINEGTKYVLTDTVTTTDWQKTVFLKTADDIKKLKESDGPDLQVWGSSQLVQLLFENDFVDELRLKIFPITLGTGKKLFGDGTIPAAFMLEDCVATPSGIVMANYKRAGDVKTGQVGPE